MQNALSIGPFPARQGEIPEPTLVRFHRKFGDCAMNGRFAAGGKDPFVKEPQKERRCTRGREKRLRNKAFSYPTTQRVFQ